MKAGRNRELDYLLINLNEKPQMPNWQEALKCRQKRAVWASSWRWTGIEQYNKYGSGVKLYFALLKYLILLFVMLTVSSIPSLISNFKGNGLAMYSGEGMGQSIMKFSLANQPILGYLAAHYNVEQYRRDLNNIRINQIIIILNDVICTSIFIGFLIFWNLKSAALVNQLVQKQALPSYQTLIIDKFPIHSNHFHLVSQHLEQHFQQFGNIQHIELIYEYGDLLMQLKQFIQLVDQYYQQWDQQTKDILYGQIQLNYLKIKNLYKEKTEQNINSFQTPFKPVKAFVVFQNIEVRNKIRALYKYEVNSLCLKMDGVMPEVRKCHVEPMSIIWQNYHLKDNLDILRSCMFGILVTIILAIALFAIFIVSLYVNELMVNTTNSPYDYVLAESLTFNDVSQSKDSHLIYLFCSSLTYTTFQLAYYKLCSQYFTSFQQKWVFMLILSVIVLSITLILIRIVFALSQLRRYRTIPQKKRFLIISIFITYFISCSLLSLLIRAQFSQNINGYQVNISLLSLTKQIFPNIQLNVKIQMYQQFNKKWYMHIGKLVMINFILSLVVCPWLYLIEEYLLRKIRQAWALCAKTQKIMNYRIIDNQFYFQFYYAVVINSIYFCMLYSIAMPLFFFLGLLSMISLFLSSKLIFHTFCRKPQMYDHKLNQIITQIISFSLLMHQFVSVYFIYVEEIFPVVDNTEITDSKWKKGTIYIIMAFIVLLYIFNSKRIALMVKKKYSPNEQLIMTEEHNITLNVDHLKNKKLSDRKVRKANKMMKIQKIEDTTVDINSYKMQDNPYYNNISYTLMILHKAIIQRKDITEQEYRSKASASDGEREDNGFTQMKEKQRDGCHVSHLTETNSRCVHQMDMMQTDRNLSY